MIKPISDEQEAFFSGAEAALRRAAQDAIELGKRTNTPVYVLRDGKIVDLLAPAEVRQPPFLSGNGSD